MKEFADEDIPLKRRRLSGACDQCRKRKIKCNSAMRPNLRCTNCIAFDTECTHDDPPKKRGPKSAYVEDLEARVQDLKRQLEAATAIQSQSPTPSIPGSSSSVGSSSNAASPPFTFSSSSAADGSSPPSVKEEEDDDMAHVELVQQMERLSMFNSPRFFGSSSAFGFAQSVNKMRTAILDEKPPEQGQPQFWYLQPWEHDTATRQIQQYIYPPHDLMETLLKLYFEQVSPLMPVLHQPTFMAKIRRGEHLRNHQFGATVLITLAIASRYTDDPRVLASKSGSKLSAGWKYFEQVTLQKNAVWDIPTLDELQAYTLSVLYIQGTSVPQTAWTILGIGLRFAIEIGVHRRKPEGYVLTAEDELKKRAFWGMLCLDRIISAVLGRPSLVRDEDFDLELPVECDDTYWKINDNDEVTFHQPLNVPSEISFFVREIRLCEILSFVSRTIWSIRKTKLSEGLTGKDFEERILNHLDVTMDTFLRELPNHLRYDPHRANGIFRRQSVSLHTLYYITHIQTHRPFVHTSASSLATCTSAARSCAHVIEKSPQHVALIPPMVIAPFIAGVALAMYMWSRKDNIYQHELQTCLRVLKKGAEIWNPSGRFWSTLNNVSAGLDSLPQQPPSKSKRTREDAPHEDTDAGPGSWHERNPSAEGSPPVPFDFNADFMRAVDMWNNAPTASSLNDWGSFVDDMSSTSGLISTAAPRHPDTHYISPTPHS